MVSVDETFVLIDLPYTKELSVVFIVLNGLSFILNALAVWHTYERGNVRNSCSSIIIANLACMEILISVKEFPLIHRIIYGEKWLFQEQWCATYGLPNVIFIIVSVSTLVTVTTERFLRYRELSKSRGLTVDSTRHGMFGYIIAHTTLSYSLTLLWSKYVFITRKAFCRVEWPPREGFSITFVSSIVFILPVSALIYNVVFKNVFLKENADKLSSEEALQYEKHAQRQVQIAVSVFLLSWSPYVVESMISSSSQVSPLLGMVTAMVPLFTTSLLPFCYVKFMKLDPPVKTKECMAVIVEQ